MPEATLVTGQAGTGKTTKLLGLTAEIGREYLIHSYQKLLVMAVMHGARERLANSFSGHAECRSLRRHVCTIDSFALSMVNRWRTALGIRLPICPREHGDTLEERHCRTHTSFDQISRLATTLLERRDTCDYLRGTFPLIVIDEFQDCSGYKLAFVQELSRICNLITAADSFQLLDTSIQGCPAVEWASSVNDAKTVELDKIRRTADIGILNVAKSLRDNVALTSTGIPVLCGQPGMIAWRIMERLIMGRDAPRFTGTCALISPSRNPVFKVLKSFEGQVRKKGFKPLRWCVQTTLEEEESSLLESLGITGHAAQPDAVWDHEAATCHHPYAEEVCCQVIRFAKLRGLKCITADLVVFFARRILHARRSFSRVSPKRIITTVHGAKNREFDHVFVFWPFQIVGDEELQRRLLYNAVTRAKENCFVFIEGNEARAKSDPVLSLLGPARPVFPAKKKAAGKNN